MTLGDGKPCTRCGTNDYNKWGRCRECKREVTRKWQKENREYSNAYQREYRRKHRQKHINSVLKWQRENPRKHRKKCRRWARRNPDKIRAKDSRRRARKLSAPGDHTAAEFIQMCQHYGNKCLACGRADVSLTEDHVIPLSMGGGNDISNIQPLCLSCNDRKGQKTTDYRTKPLHKRWVQLELLEQPS